MDHAAAGVTDVFELPATWFKQVIEHGLPHEVALFPNRFHRANKSHLRCVFCIVNPVNLGLYMKHAIFFSTGQAQQH